MEAETVDNAHVFRYTVAGRSVIWVKCFLLASAPGLFWLWFSWRKDRWEPEPRHMVLKLFGLGALMAAPAYLVEVAFVAPGSGWGHLLLDNFVRVALVEEWFKFLPVWIFAFRHREFNEPMDGIVYAEAAALGFATVENALYTFYFGGGALVQRAFTSTLMHVAVSGLVGYHLGILKFRVRPSLGYLGRGFLVAVLIHGTYDLLLSLAGAHRWLAWLAVGVLLPVSLTVSVVLVRRALAISPFRPREAVDWVRGLDDDGSDTPTR